MALRRFSRVRHFAIGIVCCFVFLASIARPHFVALIDGECYRFVVVCGVR